MWPFETSNYDASDLFISALLTFRPFHPSTLRTLNLDIRSLDFSTFKSSFQASVLDLWPSNYQSLGSTTFWYSANVIQIFLSLDHLNHCRELLGHCTIRKRSQRIIINGERITTVFFLDTRIDLLFGLFVLGVPPQKPFHGFCKHCHGTSTNFPRLVISVHTDRLLAVEKFGRRWRQLNKHERPINRRYLDRETRTASRFQIFEESVAIRLTPVNNTLCAIIKHCLKNT